MRSSRPSRRVWAIVGAFTTLLAIGLIAPTPAEAGCGHTTERPAVGLGVLRLDEAPRSADQAPPPKPCSGPSCSNKSAPVSTSTPAPPPRVELWGLVSESPSPVAADPIARAHEDARVRPARVAIAIFHPPRLPR